jgi:hypothetical protein
MKQYLQAFPAVHLIGWGSDFPFQHTKVENIDWSEDVAVANISYAKIAYQSDSGAAADAQTGFGSTLRVRATV